jgi:mannose-6-phosphate isomerase-like protein (cupin superfamily)
MTEKLDVLGAPMMIESDGSDIAAFVADHPVPAGYFAPPHRRSADDEMLLVIEGELTLLGEAGEPRIGAGVSAMFRRGTLHGFRNDTGSVVRLIVVATPGIQAAGMFRHFDRAAKQLGAAPTPPKIVAIAGEYGVRSG